MMVPLVTSGGLFTRLGHIFGGSADLLALEGGTATARVLSGASWITRESTLQTDYTASPANQSLINGDNGFGSTAPALYQSVASWQSTFTSFQQNLQQIAQNTVIKMVDADSGLQNRTLSSALSYLITQMTNNSTTVNATTVSVGAQTAVGTPTGTPTIVLSEKNGKGQTLQYAFGETLTFTCSADAQTGGMTAKQEQITVTGQAVVSSQWAYNWPGGSGVSISLNAVDPTVSNSGASINLLTNSSFETVTNTDYPDNWVYLVGVATTNFKSLGSPVLFGSKSLQILGDGSTLCSVAQPFNTATTTGSGTGGTPGKVLPQTPYAVCVPYKLQTGSPVAGVLEVSLVDGSNTVINDTAGNANSATVALTGVNNTNWHALTATFHLPAVLPSTVKLRIRFSTALDNANSVYIDGVAFNAMTQLYAGGPFASVFAGSTNLIKSDAWTLAYTPTFGAVQSMMERFFQMRSLGLQIPNTTSSPTVADTVIQ